MTLHRTALVWFRRDLRLRDNPALRYALAHARTVIPLYIHAPEEDGAWPAGAASRWWLHHSLQALDRALRDQGSRLVVRRGPSHERLRALQHETQATLLTFNRLSEPDIAHRDQGLTETFNADLEIASFNSNLLFDPGSIRNGADQPYKVFTAFWRKAEAQLEALPAPQAAPRDLRPPRRWPASITLAELALTPRIRWDDGLAASWTPGETGALTALKSFDGVLSSYDVSRNRPDVAGTSRLSPHLHFGEIGPRQILAHIHRRERGSAEPMRSGAPGMQTFRRELGWREFAHHLLHAFPETPTRPLDRRFERLRWSRARASFAAWQRGMTGYPIVDAGLRELWRTGWMHNRVRMIVASFLTKNLQHHWLEGARWFWDTLVDADLANNTLGWQWTAGCGADAAPYYRIFNPILQAERFDPNRSYIRRWIPEIAQLPDRWIHRPWLASSAILKAAGVRLDRTYPLPIVDLRQSRDEALRAFRRLQSTAT